MMTSTQQDYIQTSQTVFGLVSQNCAEKANNFILILSYELRTRE